MRFVLNFNHQCSLNCEWCYVNFDGCQPNKLKIKTVIKQFVKMNFTVITIGGGDPFQYPWILEILHYAKSEGLFVHIDTNGIGIKENSNTQKYIDEYVDLIGLPLDGATASIHNLMRSSEIHFELILKKIEWFSSIKNKLKINTLLSKLNINDLEKFANLIKMINPKIWSIYQFWELNNEENIIKKYSLDNDIFMDKTRFIKSRFENLDIKIEIAYKNKRVKKYPIVDNNGNVYIHNEDNLMTNLGSVFQEGITNKVNLLFPKEIDLRYNLIKD